MCQIVSGYKKVNEVAVSRVSTSIRMEKGRKTKEAVEERFKTQELSHYPAESDEGSFAIGHWLLSSFLG